MDSSVKCRGGGGCIGNKAKISDGLAYATGICTPSPTFSFSSPSPPPPPHPPSPPLPPSHYTGPNSGVGGGSKGDYCANQQ